MTTYKPPEPVAVLDLQNENGHQLRVKLYADGEVMLVQADDIVIVNQAHLAALLRFAADMGSAAHD